MNNNDLEEVIYRPPNYGNSIQELRPECDEKKSTVPFLYFASFILNLRMFTVGMLMTWISPTSAKLLSNDPDVNPLGQSVTTLQLSLIGASSAVGSVIGPPLLRQVYDIYGRRRSLICISTVQVIFIAILAVSTNVYFYYISLVSIGICKGGAIVGIVLYSSEITEVHNRAKLLCFLFVALSLGTITTFLLGNFFSVKILTFLCAVPLVLHVTGFFIFLPESPTYLISKGYREEGMKALTKLRNKSFSCLENEAEEIEEYISKKTSTPNKSTLAIIRENKAARKGLIMMSFLNLFVVFSGISAIIAYMEPIFNAANVGISGYLCSMIAGSVQTICCLCASYVVETWGRRPLLLVSSISSSISIFFLGLFFYLQKCGSPLIRYFQWVPIPSILFYSIGNCLGFTSVPLAISGEIFTTDVKSFAVALLIFFKNLETAVLVFVFPLLTDMFGFAWTFWISSMICALGTIFVYFEVPETKGRSLMEIQEILNK